MFGCWCCAKSLRAQTDPAKAAAAQRVGVWHRRVSGAPRCELSAARSLVVVEAGHPFGRSLLEAFTVGCVAVLLCCTACGPCRAGHTCLSFRFSEGFSGPCRSIIGRLTGPYDLVAASGVQDHTHVSTAVVSTALARSADDTSWPRQPKLQPLRIR
jgi:hypothetical protein